MLSKENNFADWYLITVDRAGLSDKRYPIKGMNVWTPYGWKIMTQIDSYIRHELDRTGHDEVCFPLMIPETEFVKEKDHIKGFDDEVYWVTHAGLNKLDVRLVIRPTSETAMYPIFSLWVRSHQDLPLKVYQIVNTFRYETKQTRPFIRVREIHFFESHTCHSSETEAQLQIDEDIKILENISKKMCLPYTLLIRTEWDKFPGAYYTIGIDTSMPNGRTLQVGSIHNYRTNFSVPYNITYEDEKGNHKNVYQTTFGMSERLIGAIIGVHGDDDGVVLPPEVAPFQCVVIPILSKNGCADSVMDTCKHICCILRGAGIRIKLDDRDVRPGSKYYDWEIKGVPLRLEIGALDIQNKVISFSRRDTSVKGSISIDCITTGVKMLLADISSNLYKKAVDIQLSRIQDIDSMDEIVQDKIIRFGWCGRSECGHKFESMQDLKILGTPYRPEPYSGKCIICGRPTNKHAYGAHAI